MRKSNVISSLVSLFVMVALLFAMTPTVGGQVETEDDNPGGFLQEGQTYTINYGNGVVNLGGMNIVLRTPRFVNGHVQARADVSINDASGGRSYQLCVGELVSGSTYLIKRCDTFGPFGANETRPETLKFSPEASCAVGEEYASIAVGKSPNVVFRADRSLNRIAGDASGC